MSVRLYIRLFRYRACQVAFLRKIEKQLIAAVEVQSSRMQEFQRTAYEVNGGVRLGVGVEERRHVAKRYFTILFCEHRLVQEKRFALLCYFVCHHPDGERQSSGQWHYLTYCRSGLPSSFAKMFDLR